MENIIFVHFSETLVMNPLFASKYSNLKQLTPNFKLLWALFKIIITNIYKATHRTHHCFWPANRVVIPTTLQVVKYHDLLSNKFNCVFWFLGCLFEMVKHIQKQEKQKCIPYNYSIVLKSSFYNNYLHRQCKPSILLATKATSKFSTSLFFSFPPLSISRSSPLVTRIEHTRNGNKHPQTLPFQVRLIISQARIWSTISLSLSSSCTNSFLSLIGN